MPDRKTLQEIFRQMLRIRMVEEKIAEEYPHQQIRCPVHLCLGQEAIAAGVCANLKHEDIVFSNHRSHGHFLAKGGDLKSMIAEIYGKAAGCCGGRGGSQHLIDISANFLGSTPIVGGVVPVAVGVAFASFLRKEKIVTVIFIGDAAFEEGVVHESLNFASLKKLPIIFVCENNLFSVFTHIRWRQPKWNITRFALSNAIPFIREDGNDGLKVYRAAKKAIGTVRRNKGPFFIEFATYRERQHVGPKINTDRYKSATSLYYKTKKNPTIKMMQYLIREKILTIAQVKAMKDVIQKEIEEAFTFAKASSFPKEGVSKEYVYA